MFVAQEKLQSNIAEYIIYIYQVEDMVRAYQFDIEKIQQNIIRPQVKSPSLEGEVVKWYEDIISEMKSRKLESKGHLHRVGEVMTELILLHTTLKDVVLDKKYIELLNRAEAHIDSFREKSDLGDVHLVEVCFNAIYMKFLLRLQKKEISQESEDAFDTMRIILAYLTKGYHEMKAGNMEMFQ